MKKTIPVNFRLTLEEKNFLLELGKGSLITGLRKALENSKLEAEKTSLEDRIEKIEIFLNM